MRSKSIFRFYGGKFNQISKILKIIEKNLDKFDIIADVFGGAGIVLLNVPDTWHKVKVYNDIDQELYTTFLVLTDPIKKQVLKEKLSMAYPVEKIFNDLKNGVIKTENDIDIAFKVIYLHTYSYSGNASSFLRHFKYHNVFHFTDLNLKRLDFVSKDWIIYNRDFREFMDIFNKKSVFLYLDPPYLNWGSDRSYKRLFSIDDFKDLKKRIDAHEGSYLLNLSISGKNGNQMLDIFGYPNEVVRYSLNQRGSNVKIKTWDCGFWYKFI